MDNLLSFLVTSFCSVVLSLCVLESKHEADVVKEMPGRPARCVVTRPSGPMQQGHYKDSHK